MDEENLSWEAYKEKHKERFERENIEEMYWRLERWTHALVFRVKNKRSGIENALNGIRSSANEIEAFVKRGFKKEE